MPGLGRSRPLRGDSLVGNDGALGALARTATTATLALAGRTLGLLDIGTSGRG